MIDSPPSKRVKMDTDIPQLAVTTPRPSLANMPEETLEAIFSVIDYTPDEHFDGLSFLNLALVCRRWRRIVQPMLNKAFARVVLSGTRNNPMDWMWCLRHILRNPHLGTHFKLIDIDVSAICHPPSKTVDELEKWTESDFGMVQAVIEKICNNDIWKISPVDDEKRTQMKAIVFRKWMYALRVRDQEAAMTLILAFTPNLEELVLRNFNARGCVEDRVVNDLFLYDEEDEDEDGDIAEELALHHFTVPGGNEYFLRRFLRGAANSAMKGSKQGEEAYLPKLAKISILAEAERNYSISIEDVLPFMMLPTLEEVELRGVYYLEEDDNELDNEDLGVKLPMISLNIEFCSAGTTGLRKILKSSPRIEFLEYATQDPCFINDVLPSPPLMPLLERSAWQLKHIVLGQTSQDNMYDPQIADVLGEFHDLETLGLKWPHIYPIFAEDSGAFWRLLPPSLQQLTISHIPNEQFPAMAAEIAALDDARAKGFIPSLTDIKLLRRELSTGDKPDYNLSALDKACKRAPIRLSHEAFYWEE